MDIFKALQLQSLGFILLDPSDQKDDPEYREYFLRHIARWYSKTFSTPLHLVEELPLVDVLQAYFEERYEQMSDEDREAARAVLVETDEERMKREAEEAALEADADKYAEEARREEEERQKRIAAKKGKLVDDTSKPGQVLIETMGGEKAHVVSSEMRSSSEIVTPKDEPVIKMEFMDAEAFERELEGHGTMGQPKS